MANPYAFFMIPTLAIIGAGILFFAWLTTEQRQPVRSRPFHPEYSTSRDESRPRAFESDSNCIVCCERSCAVLFLPCCHSCFCNECYNEYKKQGDKCPYCREKIVGISV